MNLESLLEYLFPVIFILVVLATKLAEARLKKSTSESKNKEQGLSLPTTEDIREEIQKKILERRKQNAPDTHNSPTKQQEDLSTGNYYALKLQKERERVEKTLQAARKAREQHPINKKHLSQKTSTARIRNSLKTPQLARNAYLYHEIFACPVGLRREGVIVPSWKL
ncbi:MAG TPA: hypothetical protein DIU37_05605 [Opitutae bacterium]|nr:hypothetical protein [Opitutae bacterium]|tara:strand:+ start:1583 stop:2083 length:501 start_codon:yes stop_codon:yes gene_type:complete